jgi:hypothetical protein
MNITVQPNVILAGTLSGVSRQIDVLIDARWEGGTARRIIVDAKVRQGKIDINDVEAFEGMVRDCRADRGLLVSTSGYTEGAIRRAQDMLTLATLSLEQALQFGWVYERCLGKCLSDTSVRNTGMVLWAGYVLPITTNNMWLIVQTGKCDKCHYFHIWCWDCGAKFAVPDEHIIACACGRYWASVPESVESGHVGEPESVWLLMRDDYDPTKMPVAIDRRPIR